MDSAAAEVLAERIDVDGHNIYPELEQSNVMARDAHRQFIGEIYTRTSPKGLVCLGPCSLDVDVDYAPLFDFIEELQNDNPNALIAMRANGAKPRTGSGWKGLWYSTNVTERERLFEIYQEAFDRQIPLLTEVTENTQLGALAPWLSGVWVGARDIESTALRGTMSAIHLPAGIKNGRDGDTQTVKNAISAIRANSHSNLGSGADIGTIAGTATSPGIATGILPVDRGNQELAIFARGYELPERLDAKERRKEAIRHLSSMCLLGAESQAAVLVDGTHGVPPMLDISRKDPDRFLAVLEEIHKSIINEDIKQATQIAGILGEVGPELGRTDPNLVLDDDRKRQLAKLVGITIDLLP